MQLELLNKINITEKIAHICNNLICVLFDFLSNKFEVFICDAESVMYILTKCILVARSPNSLLTDWCDVECIEWSRPAAVLIFYTQKTWMSTQKDSSLTCHILT